MKRKCFTYFIFAAAAVLFGACHTWEEHSPGGHTRCLTEAPALALSDSLSSQWEEFSVNAGSYEWNYPVGEEMTGQIACGIHPLDGIVGEKLKIAEYQGMDSVPYRLSCAVAPDTIKICEWDVKDVGNTNAEALSQTEYQETLLLDLKPDRVYEISADWSKEKLDINGFYGRASYVIVTE